MDMNIGSDEKGKERQAKEVAGRRGGRQEG